MTQDQFKSDEAANCIGRARQFAEAINVAIDKLDLPTSEDIELFDIMLENAADSAYPKDEKLHEIFKTAAARYAPGGLSFDARGLLDSELSRLADEYARITPEDIADFQNDLEKGS